MDEQLVKIQETEEYFEACILFFQEYQNLYKFPNTDILVEDVLDQIEIDNLENKDVFNENFDLQRDTVNDHFIKDFFDKLIKFNIVHEFSNFISEDLVNAPLSPKKKHEIIYLAKEIQELCEYNECDTVVDFGSGLGYLDQLIFERSKYKVMGLECNDSHYVGAKKRQRKYHMDSIENVKYIKHNIDEESHLKIEGYLKDKFPNHNGFCVSGLHACADLTVDAINLFLKMADAKALVLMPCCYHKMAFREDTKNERFKNFPLSDCLKKVFEKHKGFNYMKIPFLRLAAQPPCLLDGLEDLVFNLLARGVLQLYAHKHNLQLKRNKRKAVRLKALSNDFENYIESASDGFTLVQNNESICFSKKEQFDLEELMSIWRQISHDLTFKKAAIFILLQNYLQPVIENFILFDRLVYLKERGVNNCEMKKIVNEKLSPRCLALIASK